MRYLLSIMFFVITTVSVAQTCEYDSLCIEKAIVEFINDSTIKCVETTIPIYSSDTVIVLDTIICSPINRKGEFNKHAPVQRILSLQKEIDSLESQKIVFEQAKYSVSCYNDDTYGLFDFSKASCFAGSTKFYEDSCKKIPFVKYYWEFDEAPGFITIVVLTGHDNCYW